MSAEGRSAVRRNRRTVYRTAGAGRRLLSCCGRMAMILILSWGVWQCGVLAGKLSERISGQRSSQLSRQVLDRFSESASVHLQEWQQSLKALLESAGLFSGYRQGEKSGSSYPWEADWQGEEDWEALLLAEQTGADTQIQEVESSYQSRYDFFPEDREGEEGHDAGWLEQDADLQAEIQEEYILAEQQNALTPDTETAERQENPEAGQQELADAEAGAPEAAGTQSLAGEWTLPYTMEQLRDLDFLQTYIYNVNSSTVVDTELLDADAMLAADMSLSGDLSDGPKILIHHTHATEYFADSDPEDESTLIVGVGDYLAEILETQYGIQVIHDRTVYPYNEAYSQALTHEEELLAAYPTIEVMIDLHRDSAGSGKYTAEIDGKSMANLMFFNGLSRNVNGEIAYLPNPNLADNLAFSFQLKMVADSLYPGLCKRNYLKSYRYNLHILPKAVIVEVGDNHNTVEEAMNAMEPLAKILYTVLMGE